MKKRGEICEHKYMIALVNLLFAAHSYLSPDGVCDVVFFCEMRYFATSISMVYPSNSTRINFLGLEKQ